MSRSVAAFSVVLLLGAGTLRAQLPNPDPFSPPSRQIVMCQPMPAPPDTSVVGFRFIERDSLRER